MTSYSVSAAAPAKPRAAGSGTLKGSVKLPRSQQANMIVAHYQRMGARSAFDVLKARLLASRPVIGERRVVIGVDSIGRKRYRKEPEPIYGPPTFRNKIDENGNHV